MATNLLFTTSTELIRVSAESIVYISADGNYSTIKMADSGEYILTQQLGQMEKRISEMLDPNDNRFMRIGKSLIINRQFITYIHPSRHKMVLSDSRTFRYELTAPKDALKKLKDFIEKETTV